MWRRFAITSFIFFSVWNVSGQNRAVKFEEISVLQLVESKPLVVLIKTDWCKFCHAMQNTMLRHTKVSQLLKSEFYTVFLNAEEKKDIRFAGREFKFKNGVNELARELGTVNRRVSFPTICILNAKNEIIYQYDGFLSAQGMEIVLKKVLEK